MRLLAWTLATFSLISMIPQAQASERLAHLLGVGQGISSPSVTSPINFSSGYTNENPIGLIYQNGFRLTGQYAQNGTDTMGAEISYGGPSWGVGAGYKKNDCENCEGDAVAGLGIAIGNALGFGIRFEEDIYAASFLLNPKGQHRLGLMAELHDSESSNNDLSALGLGYSFVSQSFTLTVDASKLDHENESVNDDRILLTPGLMVRADILQVSVNYRMVVNDEDGSTEGDDEVWFGVGIGGQKYHLAVYSNYVSDVALAGSLFF